MLAVAKANGLDLDVVHIDFSNITEEHRKANKQGKVPTFIGSDGFVLTECIALAIYSTFVPSNPFVASRLRSPAPKMMKKLYFSYPCLNNFYVETPKTP